jgi:hypothetical protein
MPFTGQFSFLIMMTYRKEVIRTKPTNWYASSPVDWSI